MKNPRDALCEETLLQEALSALGGHTEVVLNLDEEERSEERAKERTMQLGNLGYDEDEIKEMDHKAATAILREADPNYESEDEDEEALGYCSTFGELPSKMKLTLLRAMIDQLLQTEEYASECYQRDEQRAEKEKELKQKEMEKRRAAAAVPNTQHNAKEGSGDGAGTSAENGGANALPPGWTCVTVEAKSSTYNVFTSPDGKTKVRSVKEAWKKHAEAVGVAADEKDGDEKEAEENGEDGAADKNGGNGNGGEAKEKSIYFTACVAPLPMAVRRRRCGGREDGEKEEVTRGSHEGDDRGREGGGRGGGGGGKEEAR